jgi:hypothetical protein
MTGDSRGTDSTEQSTRSDGESETLAPPVLTEGNILLLVESIVARRYTPIEERTQIVEVKRLRGQDLIVLEPRDDVVEGVLKG